MQYIRKLKSLSYSQMIALGYFMVIIIGTLLLCLPIASRDIHVKFLLRNGADEVVDPERDIAEKMAVRFSVNNLFDYIEITKDVAIYEIPPADNWIGKSIKESNLRVRYHVSILATKVGDKVFPLTSADHIFRANEHLMVMGDHKDVEKILKEIN